MQILMSIICLQLTPVTPIPVPTKSEYTRTNYVSRIFMHFMSSAEININ